jgi:hypothetical protein
MTHGHTTSWRVRMVFVTLALAAVLAAPALGGTSSELNLPPRSAIDAASANWAAKAKLLDAYGRPQFAVVPDVDATVLTTGSSRGFAWGDFGIGAGAMLGLMLLAIGLAAGAHYSRRSVRPRVAA